MMKLLASTDEFSIIIFCRNDLNIVHAMELVNYVKFWQSSMRESNWEGWFDEIQHFSHGKGYSGVTYG